MLTKGTQRNRHRTSARWLAAITLVCGTAFSCAGEVQNPEAPEGGNGGERADARPGEGPETAADADPGGNPGAGAEALLGYWDWDRRVMDGEIQTGPADDGRMRMAFAADGQCHYLWNEITRSDFQTPCHYTVDEDMIRFEGNTDGNGKLTGYSCTHQDWTSWAGDFVPPVQWSRFELRGDELWLAVNCHWSTVNGGTNSAKRFPYWESETQAINEECWVVFKPSTQDQFCNELCPSYAADPDVCEP